MRYKEFLAEYKSVKQAQQQVIQTLSGLEADNPEHAKILDKIYKIINTDSIGGKIDKALIPPQADEKLAEPAKQQIRQDRTQEERPQGKPLTRLAPRQNRSQAPQLSPQRDELMLDAIVLKVKGERWGEEELGFGEVTAHCTSRRSRGRRGQNVAGSRPSGGSGCASSPPR